MPPPHKKTTLFSYLGVVGEALAGEAPEPLKLGGLALADIKAGRLSFHKAHAREDVVRDVGRGGGDGEADAGFGVAGARAHLEGRGHLRHGEVAGEEAGLGEGGVDLAVHVRHGDGAGGVLVVDIGVVPVRSDGEESQGGGQR